MEHLIKLINDKGPFCLLYKVDIKHCYCWIPVDPFDLHLLALAWKGQIYFDTKIPFGGHTGAVGAQCTTDAIMYMYRNMGFNAVNLIDDTGSDECIENSRGIRLLNMFDREVRFPGCETES